MLKLNQLAMAALTVMAIAAQANAQERLSDDFQTEARKVEKDAKDRLAEMIGILKDRPVADKEFQKKIDALQNAKDELDKVARNGDRVTVAQKTAPDNATETLRNERARIPFAVLERARDALLLVADLKGLHKDTKERLVQSAETLGVYLERAIALRDKVGKVESKTFKADVEGAVKALEQLQKTQDSATNQDAIFAKVKALREEFSREGTEVLRKAAILVELANLESVSKDRTAADRLVASIEKEPKIVDAAKAAEAKFKAVKALE